MYETLLRPHEVAQLPPSAPIHAIRNKLQLAEVQKEERRLKQIAASRAKRDGAAGISEDPTTAESGSKRKRGLSNNENMEENGDSSPNLKRVKTQEMTVGKHRSSNDIAGSMFSDVGPKGKEKEVSTSPPSPLTVTQPIREVRGHTSYLTFACLLPSIFPTPTAARPPHPEAEVIQEPAQPSPEPEGLQAIDEDKDEPLAELPCRSSGQPH